MAAPKLDKKDSSSSLLVEEKDTKEIVAKGIRYKKADFKCSVCKTELDVMSFSLRDKALYCGACVVKKFGAKCCACNGQIKSSYTKILDKDWHDECFRCDGCKKIFESLENIGDIGGRPYCEKCYDSYDTGKCGVCEEKIGKGELVETMGEKFHSKCFVCAEGHEMKLGNFWKHEGKIYCQEHWEKSGLVDACYVCRKLIDSEYVKVLGKCLHTHCFKCRTCKQIIPGSDLAQLGGNWYCLGCAKQGKFEGLPPGTVVKGYFNAAGVWVPAPGSTMEPQMIKAKRLIRGYGEYEAAPGTIPPWESPCYPLAVLRLRPPKIPKEIDFRQREQYLEDSVFFEVFKMDIPTFNSLPLWRRLMLKKEQDLF